MKKSFELLEYEGTNVIVVDGEGFDWGLEESDIQKLRLAVKKDEGTKDSFVGNLKLHFIICLGEFLGRPVTYKEVNEALEKGYIEL